MENKEYNIFIQELISECTPVVCAQSVIEDFIAMQMMNSVSKNSKNLFTRDNVASLKNAISILENADKMDEDAIEIKEELMKFGL